MAGRVSGQSELSYDITIKTDRAIKDLEKLKKGFTDLSATAAKVSIPVIKTPTGFDTFYKKLSNALRDSMLESERLRIEGLKLKNQLVEGKIATEEYRAAIAQLNLERKKDVEAQRAARQSIEATVGSYKEAQNRLRILGNEIRNTTNGFKSQTPELKAKIREYNQLNDGLKNFDASMGNHQRRVGQYGRVLGSLRSELVSLASTFVSAYAIMSGVQQVIASNAEISDSLANVSRTAQLTKTEADVLIETLKRLDTRTSLKGLVDIATIGGQMGVAKDDIAGFTKSIDQLSVVLADEIPGGAEEVASALGKINGVFKTQIKEGTDIETAYQRTGSAILGLGQAGLATGAFLQDFALRVGGAAVAADISLPTMLAYGSILEEAGSSAEVAGTSVNRLIGSLSSKRDKFFAIAQLSDATLTLQRFTNQINTDASAALDMFFRGLNHGNPTLTEFNDRLDTIGIKAGPSKNAIIALAQNQEKLSEKVKASTQDYLDAGKVTDQFALKNENLAAALSKLWNNITNEFISSRLSSSLAEIINSMANGRTEAENLTAAYLRQKQETEALESEMTPLVSRFDELKEKGQLLGGQFKLTKDDQDELRSVTAQIGALMPSVITQFDKYGNALDINRSKVDQMTKAQRELLALQNESAINSANEQYKNAKGGQAMYQDRVLRGKKSFLGFNLIGDQEVAEFSKQAKLYNGIAYEAAKSIQALGGALTKEQQSIIDFYEKVPQTVTNAGREVIQVSQDIQDSSARTEDVIRAEIKSLEDLQKPLDVHSKKYAEYASKIKALKKELSQATGTGRGSGQSEFEAAVNRAKELGTKINDLRNESLRNQLTSDEAEIAALRDKFSKMKKEIVDFYADSKNKGVKININGQNYSKSQALGVVSSTQSSEEERALANQANSRLKKQLDEQAEMFEQYEALKEKIGEEAAQRRFQANNVWLNKEFTTAEGFLQELEEKRKKFLDDNGDPTGYTEAQKQALQIYDSQIDTFANKRKSKDNALFQDVFEATKSHNLKLIEIEVEYQRKKAALGEKATATQLGILSRERDQRIRDENMANLDMETNWENLFDNYLSMTKDAAIEHLKTVRKKYQDEADANGQYAREAKERVRQISAEIDKLAGNNSFNKVASALKVWRDLINDGKKGSVEAKLAFQALASAISNAAGDVNQVLGAVASGLDRIGAGSEETRKTIDGLMGVVSGFEGVAKGLATGNPVDVITGSITLLTSAISLFDKHDKKIQNRIDAYQAQLKSLGASFEALERGLNYSVGNDYYSDSQKQIDLLKQQRETINRLISEERGKKKVDNDKVMALLDQYNAIQPQIDEIERRISENLIQGTFKDLSNSLADALTQAFQAGEDGIKQMDSVFESFIANAIKNSLKMTYLEPIIKRFTESMIDYAKAHDNSLIGFDFGSWRDEIKSGVDDFNKGLDSAKQYFPEITIDINADFDQVKDQLFELVNAGRLAADEVGQAFDMIIRDKVLNAFKAEAFTEGLKPFYDKLKEFQDQGPLNKDQIEILKGLYNTFLTELNGKLTDLEKTTGLTFIIDVEAEKAKRKAEEMAEAIKTGLGSLADSVTGIFDSSNQAAEDFITNFDKLFKDSILENFKNTFLKDQLSAFYTDFYNLTKDGAIPAAAEVEAMRARYDAIIAAADDKIKEIEDSTGIKITFDVDAEKAKQEAERLKQEAQQIADTIKSEVQTLQDSVFTLFQNGTLAAEDFGNNFQDIIKRAILAGFQQQVFADGLKSFYDQLKAFQAAPGGLTKDNIAVLRAEYDAFVANAMSQLNELGKVTGIEFNNAVKEEFQSAANTIDSEFESLQDSILAIFAGGKDAAEDFTTSFEELMRKALLNSFKQQYLAGALKGFYDQLNAYTAGGQALSEAQIAALKVQYDAIIANGKERLKEFEQVSGESLSSGLNSRSTNLGSNIREIKETTANALEGVDRKKFTYLKLTA